MTTTATTSAPARAISFAKLCREYKTEGAGFVEITERADALSQINARTSSCWGAGRKIGDSGWIQLATPSAQSRGDLRTIFVCRASLVAPEPVTP